MKQNGMKQNSTTTNKQATTTTKNLQFQSHQWLSLKRCGETSREGNGKLPA